MARYNRRGGGAKIDSFHSQKSTGSQITAHLSKPDDGLNSTVLVSVYRMVAEPAGGILHSGVHIGQQGICATEQVGDGKERRVGV